MENVQINQTFATKLGYSNGSQTGCHNARDLDIIFQGRHSVIRFHANNS